VAVQSTREPAPQPVLSPLPAAAVFLVLTIDPGGSDAWDRLFAGPRPVRLHPFTELTGPRHRAPATPGDLLFHVRANRMDLCFDFSTAVTGGLFFAPSADFLGSPPALPSADQAAADAPPATAPLGDGSLGIGSLKK
jgi:deferrochelatase/peroxidase EfeB